MSSSFVVVTKAMLLKYFSNYFLHQSDVTFKLSENAMEVHDGRAEPWVYLVDTGENSMTGGRLGAVSKFIKNEKAFCFTYGDGVSDIDITKLLSKNMARKRRSQLYIQLLDLVP